jgi:hypothetical protein
MRIRGQFDCARLNQSIVSASCEYRVPFDARIRYAFQSTDLLSIASLRHQGESHGVWCRLNISLNSLFSAVSRIPLAPPYG